MGSQPHWLKMLEKGRPQPASPEASQEHSWVDNKDGYQSYCTICHRTGERSGYCSSLLQHRVYQQHSVDIGCERLPMECVGKWLGRPREIYNLLRFKMGGGTAVMPLLDQDALSDNLKSCYRYLNQTSRSFAAVIQALDGELRHAVCILYLVLRALDTVEDDMTISLETKVPMLHDFHSYLYQPDWRYMKSKEKYKQVLEDFPTISLEFRNLAKVYRDVIADICHKMGAGMAEFLQKKIESLQEWDKYCHYVVGLVGIGLSRLFSVLELEDPVIGQDTELANSMGVFIEKAIIIRDYLEDQLEGREFWPREVWSKYAKKLSDLAKPENIDMAVQCMNELIINALHHIPDVLTYLSRLKTQSVFNFCAIPQVMAIATLAACYNNKQVFRGVVKIRKGQAVTLMMDATNIQAVKSIMYQYVEEIYRKIPSTDPSSNKTQQILVSIQTICFPNGTVVSRNRYSPIYLSCAMLLAVLSWRYLSAMSEALEEDVQAKEN